MPDSPPFPVPQVPELLIPHRKVEITVETCTEKHVEIHWWKTSRNTLPLPYAGIFLPRALRQSSGITVAFSCLEQANYFLFNTGWLQCPSEKGEKGDVIHEHRYLLLSDFSSKNITLVSALSRCKSCLLVLSLHLTHPTQQVYFHAL